MTERWEFVGEQEWTLRDGDVFHWKLNLTLNPVVHVENLDTNVTLHDIHVGLWAHLKVERVNRRTIKLRLLSIDQHAPEVLDVSARALSSRRALL